MSRLGSFIPSPDKEYLVSRNQLFKLRFGKRVLLNGKEINPFAYDPSNPKSILKALDKLQEATEYLFNKKVEFDKDADDFIESCKKVKREVSFFNYPYKSSERNLR